MKKPVGIEHWRKKKVRKPKELKYVTSWYISNFHGHIGKINIGTEPMDSKQCRKLSKWLAKTADWLERQGR